MTIRTPTVVAAGGRPWLLMWLAGVCSRMNIKTLTTRSPFHAVPSAVLLWASGFAAATAAAHVSHPRVGPTVAGGVALLALAVGWSWIVIREQHGGET